MFHWLIFNHLQNIVCTYAWSIRSFLKKLYLTETFESVSTSMALRRLPGKFRYQLEYMHIKTGHINAISQQKEPHIVIVIIAPTCIIYGYVPVSL